ncbi:MAG: AAA family ATPase [Hyphomicrobiaceae bacterium]
MSLTDVERGLLARYLVRIFSRKDLPLRSARAMLWWFAERADGLGIAIPAPVTETMATRYNSDFRISTLEQVFVQCREELVAALERAARETERPEPLAANARRLVEALGIPSAEAAWKVVGLLACGNRYEQVQYLANYLLETAGPVARAIAILVDEPTSVVEELLMPSHDLVASGLVQVRDGDQVAGHGSRYVIPFRVNRCLDRTYRDFAEMRDAMLGTPQVSGVGPADYQHVAADRDLIIGVLKGAAAAAAPGLNILLYGPPGSGKTELAKVAAAEAGLTLYAAGEDASEEASRASRVSDLVFSSRLLSEQKRTAILFDEMEDAASDLIRRGGSKVFLNRLLETGPVPVIWTSNDISSIDPALLRRMTLAIELKRPPASQRRRIIEQILARAGLVLTEVEVERLAQRLDATPAIIENAIRAAKLAGGGVDMIERAAQGVIRAVSGITARKALVIPAFDPELTSASIDLVGLADQIVGGRRRAFSLCLSGPPGTGKSAYARYLAGRLGLEIVQKRASDLLGAYVGQSERNIADAFLEAREAGTFLVFDEADSLLLDRRDAQRSWEISQVNEMLTWMEDHPLPVCFTTNLMDRMDSASLRRFTFDVRFRHLDRSALGRAWKVFFGLDAAPSGGAIWENLTPGDFAKARKQAEVLGIVGDTERLVELLDGISRGKPDAGGSFGFVG